VPEGFRKNERTDPTGTASCFEPLEPAVRFFIRTIVVYKRLRLNFIILILLISLTPFLLLGGIFSYEFSSMSRSNLEEQIKYRARLQANAVDLYLRGRTAILSGVADLHTIDELVDGKALARLLEIINMRAGGFVDLGVIDDKGQHLAYVGPYNLKGLNYNQQRWFAEVMSKGLYISDVYMGYRQIPHYIIAVRRQENQQAWVLRATIDSDAFNTFVRETKVGKTGDAYIINREGVFQTKPRFEGEILGESGLDPSLFGEGAVVERQTNEGRRILIASSWLKNKDWLLVITQDAAEGMGAFFKTRNAQRIYMAIGCLAIFLITAFTTHLSVRRIEKTYQRKDEFNAQMIQDRTPLRAGDRIYIENYVLIFQPDETPPESLEEERTTLHGEKPAGPKPSPP